MEICEKGLCSGCGCCEHICPRNAITMHFDEEGFLRPDIDTRSCVECGLCQKKCPVNITEERLHTEAYAAYAKDKEIRKSSSSGGIFSLLAQNVIAEGGVVFGAGFSEGLRVVHKSASTHSELLELRGSKYVQSDLRGIYEKVGAALSDGKKVLFSGTPCQCAAVRSVFGDKENLLIADFICHGVPTPKLWERFVLDEFQSPTYASFRDKRLGWEEFSMRVESEKGTYTCSRYKDPYLRLFLKNVALRPSCYNCTWKANRYQSDITLLDFWGISSHYPHMNDDKGVSGVVVRGEKGRKAFDAVKDKAIFEKADIKEISRVNTAYHKSTPYSDLREGFFDDLKSGYSFGELSKKHVRPLPVKDMLTLRSRTAIKVLIGKIYKLKKAVFK